MSENKLEVLFFELQQCLSDTAELNKKLELLEARRDLIPLTEYIDQFEVIQKEAQVLNIKKDQLGEEIKKLAPEFDQ